MYLPSSSHIFYPRNSIHTIPSASNSISNPQEGSKQGLLEMLFRAGRLGSKPLKLVSNLKTRVLRPTGALDFGRLQCGFYPRSTGVDELTPSIILNDSSATALAVDVMPMRRLNVDLFALSMADIIGHATIHACSVLSYRGGIGYGLDRVKPHYHLGTNLSSLTIRSYPITRATSFHSLSISTGDETSAIPCDAKKPYGVVKPVQPKPDTTTVTPSRRISVQTASRHSKNPNGVFESLPSPGPETIIPTPSSPVVPSTSVTFPGDRMQSARQVLEPTISSSNLWFVPNGSMIEEYISNSSASVCLDDV